MPGPLIVRLPNWLGDTVMAVPLLRALRCGRPESRLVAVGPWATLLAGQALADVLITYPRRWTERLRTAHTVRAVRPEIAILLPNSLEAAVAARYWGARRRIGFAGEGRDWLLTDRLPLPSPRLHQIDEYGRLLAPFGIEPAEREPRLASPDAAGESRRRVRALLADAGVRRAEQPVIGVHIGAVFGPSKLWPAEHIAAFCRLLRRDGATPVLLGAPGDAALVDAVTAAGPVPSLVGRDSPDLLPALLAEIDALVCGDTGVGHLAAALGTPVVALFGPTDPMLTAPRGPAAVLTHPTPCAPCFYRICPIEHPCLRGIAPETVRDRVLSLVGART
jgi:heptosyltransferase-2